MLILPISRGWLLSRKAQRVYLGSAIGSIGSLGVVFGTIVAMVAAGQQTLAGLPTARVAVEFLLFPTAVGAGLLLAAMWYFWFSFDGSHWAKRAFWFLFLMFVPLIGPVLYYFLVYRRSVRLLEPGR
jgi:hypothetical protein